MGGPPLLRIPVILLLLLVVQLIRTQTWTGGGVVVVVAFSSTPSTPQASSSSRAYDILDQYSSQLLDPLTGHVSTRPFFVPPETEGEAADDGTPDDKYLVIVLPQLGEFDASEYVELFVAQDVQAALHHHRIHLRVIGLGNSQAGAAGTAFCNYTGLSPTQLWMVDPASSSSEEEASLYEQLQLYAGPNLSIPDSVPDAVLQFFLKQLPGGVPLRPEELRPVANAWLKYNAMCAGIGAPGTLAEILRGYVGDVSAPERFRDDDVVQVPPAFLLSVAAVGSDFLTAAAATTTKQPWLTIGPGVGPTQLGPLRYTQWFADERGYQRPVELATVRLKNLIEVLTKWDRYVGTYSSNTENTSSILTIAQRGGTYLFDADGTELYSYKSQGVLTYSATMARPLLFLAPYIGTELARNPLQLLDTTTVQTKQSQRGRGLLKPVGKLLQLVFASVFHVETKFQADMIFGATKDDRARIRQEIESVVASSSIVLYTYGWSPFSTEACALLDEMEANYHTIELGAEWFVLNKEQSTVRAELFAITGQSSLPQIFINGHHIGGLFTGGSHGRGLAGMKESGELQTIVDRQQKGNNESAMK